jgi:hypothetical protein
MFPLRRSQTLQKPKASRHFVSEEVVDDLVEACELVCAAYLADCYGGEALADTSLVSDCVQSSFIGFAAFEGEGEGGDGGGREISH